MTPRAMRISAVGGGAAAVAVLIVGGWLYWEGPSGRADPRDAQQVSHGSRVYSEACASCHGQRLEGQPNWQSRLPNGRLPAPPHDETGHTWHHPDDVLFRLSKFGLRPPLAPEEYESDMPAFEDKLSDKDIWAVLAYIKSTWPPVIRARQERLNKAYQK